MTLADLLRRPEGKTLDFKRDLSSTRSIVKDVVAFANTAGGTLVVGVGDDRVVYGIVDALRGEERLANVVADSIAPPLLPDTELATHEGKDLLIVRVGHWHGPFYIRTEGPEDGVYVRLGSKSRRAGPELLAELRRAAANVPFDGQACDAVSDNGLDRLRIDAAFGRIGVPATEARLLTLGVLVEHAGQIYASNGGVILFGLNETRQRHFPDAYVRCARFRGDDRAEIIDRLDLREATMIEAIDEIERFIRRNTRVAAPVEGMRRREVPEYSTVMIRETVVNAVAHGDYSLTGMQTKVAIFADRLVIENPGLMPFGMTIEQLKAGQSKIRNRVIARVLDELDLLEGWGRAWERIQRAVAEGYPEPDLAESGLSFRAVLWPHPVAATSPRGDGVDVGVPVGVGVGEERRAKPTPEERRAWILTQIDRRDGIKVPDIVAGLGIVPRTAERDVAALVREGEIEFVGPPRTGKYRRRSGRRRR